jgi:Methyladenine glycosylase
MIRCAWVPEADPLYLAYHDEEWGVPSRDPRHLFEMLVLKGAQAGLSWSTILRKREGIGRSSTTSSRSRADGDYFVFLATRASRGRYETLGWRRSVRPPGYPVWSMRPG